MEVNVTFQSDDEAMQVSMAEEGEAFPCSFGEVQKVYIPPESADYEGRYEVTPKLSPQELPTQGKFLEEDIKIRAIPIVKMANTSGGNTVIIGG